MKINRKTKGIICIIAAAFGFSLMSVFVRLAGDLPSFQKAFFRNLIALIFMAGALFKKKSGFYLVKVDPDKREDLLNILSNGLGSTVDLNSPCIYTGTKD